MKTKQAFLVLVSLLCVTCPSSWTQQFGEWSPPVNLGTPVNGPEMDFQPFISRDGLSLYDTYVYCPVPGCNQDIEVSKRSAIDAPWQPPQLLPPTINTAKIEGTPVLTTDGHFLLFASQREGGYGGNDLYISKRKDKRVDTGPEDGGWEVPVNLGPGINTGAVEAGPALFQDEQTGVITLHFQTNRRGTLDIFMSTLQPDGTFGQAVPVAELNSGSADQQPAISRNGLEIYFASDRPGSIPYPADGCCGPAGQPSMDIWVSTRATTSDGWSVPQPVTALNSPYSDLRPSLSFDGKSIYFGSAFRTEDCQLRGQCNVSRYYDIWMSTREKLIRGAED